MQFEIGNSYPFQELPVKTYQEVLAFKLAIADQADPRLGFIWIKVSHDRIFPICENSLEGIRSVNFPEKGIEANYSYDRISLLDHDAMVVVVKKYTAEDHKKEIRLASSSENAGSWLRKEG